MMFTSMRLEIDHDRKCCDYKDNKSCGKCYARFAVPTLQLHVRALREMSRDTTNLHL
jgi:hypothetical protein